ncbi:hypothetical protein BHE74_00010552 [Ensete ventricosum]|nr:hypothetical protein BHE74_00010552 [Ensete ventricosum]RZR94391.1 hypothetical protein BHM03_00023074 [Ensete ventricosum]
MAAAAALFRRASSHLARLPRPLFPSVSLESPFAHGSSAGSPSLPGFSFDASMELMAHEANFAFTSSEEGDYLACLWVPNHNPPATMAVEFEWQTGVIAKDWTNIAKKGQIDCKRIALSFDSLSMPG